MKIAVISDIHGNLAALEAVLADIEARGADLIVNLGDLLSGPLEPARTADRLIGLDLPTIGGNHERQLLTFAPEQMGATDAFTSACLKPEHWEWLASLPKSLRLEGDLLLVHGAPRSDVEYLLETVTQDGCRAATEAEVAARAEGANALIILCGHTHLQRRVQLADGRIVINPGSVGLPAYADDRPWPHVVEAGSPHARYALLENSAEDGCLVEFIACDYDWEAAAALAARNGRADWAAALATGHL